MDNTFKVTLLRNGKKVADINPEKFSFAGLSKAIDVITQRVFEYHKLTIGEQAKEILSAHARTRVDGAAQLASIYAEAIGKSKVEFGTNSSRMMFLDIDVLDTKAKDRRHDGKPEVPWWRVYEYGSPSARSGATAKYRFVPIDELTAHGGDETKGKGKHGEGVMIKNTNSSNPGHPGVQPFHVMTNIKDHLKELVLQGRLAEQVLQFAALEISRQAQ